MRGRGWAVAVSLVILFGSVACQPTAPPDSGVVGTFFVAHTTGSVPSPFPTAPPWPGAEGEVAPGAGTLTVDPANGKTMTFDVDGAFRIPLYPGRYTIEAHSGGGEPWGPTVVRVSAHTFTRIQPVVRVGLP